MLRATRRLLRPGGRTAILTIEVAPGLSRARHRRAVRLGPRAVAARRPAAALLEQAGFLGVAEEDVTGDFLHTARAWLSEVTAREGALRAAVGDDLFEEQQSDRADLLRAIEEGLIRRVLVSGSAPG